MFTKRGCTLFYFKIISIFIHVKETLEILSKHHNDWLYIVKSFGVCYNQEDIVQEFYLRVYKYNKTNIVQEGKPVKVMCWIMLRNLYFDNYKQESQYTDLPLLELVYKENDNEIQIKLELEERLNHIEQTKKALHHFDRGILELYSQMSLRKISSETKISLKSVFNSVKLSKQIIKEQWQKEKQED